VPGETARRPAEIDCGPRGLAANVVPAGACQQNKLSGLVERGGRSFQSSEHRGTAMAKGKRKLEVVHLVCQETGDQNYTLRRKSGGEKLKVKKYSPRLRKHTLHQEKKK
jgi:large subunit ribosomal protein L33